MPQPAAEAAKTRPRADQGSASPAADTTSAASLRPVEAGTAEHHADAVRKYADQIISRVQEQLTTQLGKPADLEAEEYDMDYFQGQVQSPREYVAAQLPKLIAADDEQLRQYQTQYEAGFRQALETKAAAGTPLTKDELAWGLTAEVARAIIEDPAVRIEIKRAMEAALEAPEPAETAVMKARATEADNRPPAERAAAELPQAEPVLAEAPPLQPQPDNTEAVTAEMESEARKALADEVTVEIVRPQAEPERRPEQPRQPEIVRARETLELLAKDYRRIQAELARLARDEQRLMDLTSGYLESARRFLSRTVGLERSPEVEEADYLLPVVRAELQSAQDRLRDLTDAMADVQRQIEQGQVAPSAEVAAPTTEAELEAVRTERQNLLDSLGLGDRTELLNVVETPNAELIAAMDKLVDEYERVIQQTEADPERIRQEVQAYDGEVMALAKRLQAAEAKLQADKRAKDLAELRRHQSRQVVAAGPTPKKPTKA
jgi:hypothetical protein